MLSLFTFAKHPQVQPTCRNYRVTLRRIGLVRLLSDSCRSLQIGEDEKVYGEKPRSRGG